MTTPITADDVTRALADAIANACAARMAETATLQASAPVPGEGWLVAVPTSGAASGRLCVWFERKSAIALGRAALKLDIDPADDAIVALLRESVGSAAAMIESTPAAAGITIGEPSITAEAMPPTTRPYEVMLSGGMTCRIALSAQFRPASAAAAPNALAGDMRLEAVLDVDLPLVVRFGRAVMPLRTLADLGPGSVIDMGRAPDDPVELLVGERLIAKGEVVIVGGNYGVRITELAGAAAASADLETRAS